MERVRIAVTGIGLVTPLGCNAPETWVNLCQGNTAGKWLTDLSGELPREKSTVTPFGAPVDHVSRGDAARTTQFALLASEEAIRQAGLDAETTTRAGCVIGTSKIDLSGADQFFLAVQQADRSSVPEITQTLFPSSPASAVSQRFNIQGPLLAPVAACATGLVSVIRAAELIRHGTVNCVLAGASDSSLHPGLMASYRRLGVLARPGGAPGSACRPFDATRSGFMVGEGAAVLVMEEWEQARKRGARPLAEWVDGNLANDPSGITQVDITGASLAKGVTRLLKGNRVTPDSISAISYHGTATEMNDLAEAQAMSRLFANVPIGFGVKGAIGHLMGAAGAVETALSVLALQEQMLPPTANHVQHDPRCPNRLTSSDVRRQPIEYLLKTSLGFGGHFAVGLLKRVDL